MLLVLFLSLAPLTSATGMKFFVLYDHVSTEDNYLFTLHTPQNHKKCLASPSSTPQVNPQPTLGFEIFRLFIIRNLNFFTLTGKL